jgi:ABC-2 type transport system permease protein
VTTLVRVTAAEAHKLWTVRNYPLSIAMAGVGVVATAGVMAVATATGAGGWDPQAVALPLEYFAYTAMVVGVLVVTADNATGTALVTRALVPWRSRVELGKYLVAGVGGAVAAVVVGAMVVLAVALGSGVGPGAVLTGDPLAVTLSGVVSVAVAAVLGVAVGILLRQPTTAISLLLGWALVVETVLAFVLPPQWSAFLPFKTIGGSRLLIGQLGAWTGLLVFTLCTAALVALAALVRARRDAPVG